MSSPPPHSHLLAHDKSPPKRKDRPPALEIPNTSTSPSHLPDRRPSAEDTTKSHIEQLHHDQPNDDLHAHLPSRSTSATSSLDPYYFSVHSPSGSPIPPLPDPPNLSKTPETRPATHDPVTPHRDPSKIDRRVLHGLGELATPRWTRTVASRDDDAHGLDQDELDPPLPEEPEEIDSDSPWTIEAIDGEEDEERDEPSEFKSIPRMIRARPSVTEESGGEEILYPRTQFSRPLTLTHPAVQNFPFNDPPPISFAPLLNKARKRTSDEFERDQAGSLITKHQRTPSGSVLDGVKEERASARKHHSLGVGLPSSSRDRPRERRKESISTSGNVARERHSRHTSASSSSSSHGEQLHSRRVHPNDFSHLPPSPSTSSIQQFLRHVGSNGAVGASASAASQKEASNVHTPNVAHSLLRGTQEGWSDLDDQATAEALRKLDGISSKSSARVRLSVGSLRSSRPGTPAKSGQQWEGMGSDSGKTSRRSSAHIRDSTSSTKDKDQTPSATRQGVGFGDFVDTLEQAGSVFGSSDETQLSSPAQDKPPIKKSSASIRLSYTAKRGSASSTTYTSTPTTSSRDSGSMSAGTSLTSISAQSGRHSTSKARRNSVGSDASQSGDVAFLKDRVASLAASNEQPETGQDVPPVPPLPKDLSTYRSPPQSSAGTLFPVEGTSTEESTRADDNEPNRFVPPVVATAPIVSKPLSPPPYTSHGDHQGYASAPAVLKTPSKKWSLLGMKLSGSPSATKDNSGAKRQSPHSAALSQPSRRSISKDSEPWSPIQQPDAMASAASLASHSSLSSSHALSASGAAAGTPDQPFSSRPDTASSSHKSNSLAAPQQTPLSPSGSIRRGSSKRLTPSAIPFFRRSSSHSIQAGVARSSSPPASTGPSHLQTREPVSPVDSSLSTPPGAHKKSSIISLGSLLKGSSSRRNLQSGKDDPKSDRESRRARDTDGGKSDKEKVKKDDKDRSESRISMLMGRKRGKTLSSAESKKQQPVSMPPMQMSALPQATAQRVANLKATPPSNGSATAARSNVVSSRATAQTISSLQRQSDTSLRSRTQLPTIAGSPSVGTAGSNSQISREMKERDLPPSSGANGISVNPKETPTKIPRIHSRTSTVSSPALKPSTSSTTASRRTSLIVTSVAGNDPSPTPGNTPGNGSSGSINKPAPITDEFGVLDISDVPKATLTTVTQRQSIRASPSSSTASRVPRQVSNSTSTSNIPRKGNRDSMSFGGLRKSSTSSVASLNSVAPSDAPSTQTTSHRFSALSPSKGLKLLSPKVSLTHSRSSNSSNTHQVATPSSSRLSLSTPSPAPSSVDEEELLGDEEMLQYIKRQQQKKLAHGATQEELDALLRFPEPLPPVAPQSPSAVLKSSQRQHLSEFECQEILDYPSVYYIGTGSEKKLAHPDKPTNNFGYDDDRGDYLVVDHDHLAYRYEVMDSLGKGSFGQVLSCRDHATGASVAIKIIRNKKRFHHQALVEIKILDNLRQWDPEEKHHVIKMTEHFYFRNHLCIAMELLSINLYELIKANGFVGFTTALIRRFTSQMLMSLTLMRHHRIVHCDLKPENVLLRHPAKSAIKVIDFGSSCFEHEKIYTYIQSRFYRSPEVILGMNYHMAIDMWSLGCILAELKTGFPIFPGENEQEQLSCIMEVLGLPDKDFVNRSSRKRLFFDSTGAPRPVVNSKGRRRRPGTKTLAQVLRCEDELFIDFVSKCLMWDPERRIKPQNAMRHPFITAGKRSKGSTPSSTTAKALLSTASSLTSRSKPTDTPKKSQISAPTPLTARISRTTNAQPSTPGGASTSMHSLGSARSYRTSQSQTISSYHSSRTISGFASTSSTK